MNSDVSQNTDKDKHQTQDGKKGQNETSGNPNNGKPKKKEYDGSKHPMLAISMMSTSKAISNALTRISVRRDWIAERISQLKSNFESNDPTLKKEAFEEANALKESLQKLDNAENMLKEKLPEVQEEERQKLSTLEFPEFDI